VLLLILTIWTLTTSISGSYAFPPAGIAFGWLLSLCSLGPLVVILCRHGAPLLLRRLKNGITMPTEVTPGTLSSPNGARPMTRAFDQESAAVEVVEQIDGALPSPALPREGGHPQEGGRDPVIQVKRV
jgi:hypothetical protein